MKKGKKSAMPAKGVKPKAGGKRDLKKNTGMLPEKYTDPYK